MVVNAAQEQTTAEGVPRLGQAYDIRFQDPTWLAWWLSTHFMLAPAEQIELADRIKQTVHSRDCQDVLAGFIEHTRQGFEVSPHPQIIGQGIEGVNLPESDEMELQDRPLWYQVAGKVWQRYKPLVIGCGLIVAIYIVRAIVLIFGLVFG